MNYSLLVGSRRARICPKMRQSGAGVAYYGYRHYDPVTGRWPSRDPIQERGGVNLYGFVYNRPHSFYDVLGKAPGPYHAPNWGIPPATPADHSDGLSYPEAAAHYFGGGGEDVTIPFSSIDPGWELEEFGVDPCSREEGVYEIEENRTIETLLDLKMGNGGPGRVTLTLSGMLSIGRDSEGCKIWSFGGGVTPERANEFDFNDDPTRGWFLNYIAIVIGYWGPSMGGEDFTVNITGDRPIEKDGNCDK